MKSSLLRSAAAIALAVLSMAGCAMQTDDPAADTPRAQPNNGYAETSPGANAPTADPNAGGHLIYGGDDTQVEGAGGVFCDSGFQFDALTHQCEPVDFAAKQSAVKAPPHHGH